MTQEILVYIIVAGAIILAALRIYRKIIASKTNDPCGGCSGCDVKKQIDERKKGCRESDSKRLEHLNNEKSESEHLQNQK